MSEGLENALTDRMQEAIDRLEGKIKSLESRLEAADQLADAVEAGEFPGCHCQMCAALTAYREASRNPTGEAK